MLKNTEVTEVSTNKIDKETVARIFMCSLPVIGTFITLTKSEILGASITLIGLVGNTRFAIVDAVKSKSKFDIILALVGSIITVGVLIIIMLLIGMNI